MKRRFCRHTVRKNIKDIWPGSGFVWCDTFVVTAAMIVAVTFATTTAKIIEKRSTTHEQ